MKKLLLLLLIPSISFATYQGAVRCRDDFQSVGFSSQGKGVFDIFIGNDTNMAQNYSYGFHVYIPEGKDEHFKGYVMLAQGQAMNQEKELSAWHKYNTPGDYQFKVVTAIDGEGKHIEETKYCWIRVRK